MYKEQFNRLSKLNTSKIQILFNSQIFLFDKKRISKVS